MYVPVDASPQAPARREDRDVEQPPAYQDPDQRDQGRDDRGRHAAGPTIVRGSAWDPPVVVLLILASGLSSARLTLTAESLLRLTRHAFPKLPAPRSIQPPPESSDVGDRTVSGILRPEPPGQTLPSDNRHVPKRSPLGTTISHFIRCS